MIDNLWFEKYIKDEDVTKFNNVTGVELKHLYSEMENNKFDTYLTNDKHIESELDELGLHVFRCILSENIINHRRKKIHSLDFNWKLKAFYENGFFVWPNFDNQVDELESLLQHITTNRKLKIDKSKLSKGFQRKDVFVEGDLQYTLHVDTFHPAFKIFLYPNDVKIENGPFCYVPKSHKNTESKLKFLFQASKDRSRRILKEGLVREDDPIVWNDSFRLSKDTTHEKINDDLTNLGLNEEYRIEVDADTLIIADTSGFHRRHPLEEGFKRMSFRMVMSRNNPFFIRS
tara:strand:- start:5191 stop:6054 length:864 start_codon:yes stop_codon:yes gene_type:complete